MDELSTISALVKYFRGRVGQERGVERVSQQVMADELGLSRVMVSNFERGVSEPTLDFLAKMLKKYPADDWRFSFAVKCFRLKTPELFEEYTDACGDSK